MVSEAAGKKEKYRRKLHRIKFLETFLGAHPLLQKVSSMQSRSCQLLPVLHFSSRVRCTQKIRGKTPTLFLGWSFHQVRRLNQWKIDMLHCVLRPLHRTTHSAISWYDFVLSSLFILHVGLPDGRTSDKINQEPCFLRTSEELFLTTCFSSISFRSCFKIRSQPAHICYFFTHKYVFCPLHLWNPLAHISIAVRILHIRPYYVFYL